MLSQPTVDDSVIEWVNRLIQDAINKDTSDIHLEPSSTQYRIRFRHDGLLYQASIIDSLFAAQVTTRLKIMFSLNIAEKRLPQDGRLKWQGNQPVDLRISTCPTLFGEKIVLRILNTNHRTLAVSSLGMTTEQQALFVKKLSRSQGLILVTGPTGSGKTTTLYSALHHLNRIEKNISTVEDPVEIELAGINQINTHPRIGLDFAHILRALLRQDPDIIMVGEIRDKETAHIALQAAETGHLVLSSLHTNQADESITRLQSMGIQSQSVLNATSLIIAQRLIRTICPHCQTGCKRCRGGHMGRVGLFELLAIDNGKQQPYMTLWDAGMQKVEQGITTEVELSRVFQ